MTSVCLLFSCPTSHFLKTRTLTNHFSALVHEDLPYASQQGHFPQQRSRCYVSVTRDTADEQALTSLGNVPQCPQLPPSNSGTHLGFQFISKVGVIEVHKAKKQGTFLRNVVIFGNLFLHILFQERHVAEKTTGEGPEQLEQQFYIAVIPSAGSSESTDEVPAHFRTRQDL